MDVRGLDMEGNFSIGDNVVCPAHGVGEVVGIEQINISGRTQEFYIISIQENGMRVFVPTEGSDTLGLRNVISETEARKVFRILRSKEVAVNDRPWSKRCKRYSQMLKTGSPFDVAQVLRDLLRLKRGKELSFAERRLLNTARTLLVKELALARSTTESRIAQQIDRIFRSKATRATA
jgi:CarD family transcriptional regulator